MTLYLLIELRKTRWIDSPTKIVVHEYTSKAVANGVLKWVKEKKSTIKAKIVKVKL